MTSRHMYRDLPTPEQKVEAKLFLESRRDWTQWKSERLLGCGRHSIVALFSRDRMVNSRHFAREKQYAAVKETNNYYQYLERGQLPEEIMALTKLKPFKCNSIVKLRKWGPLPKPKSYYDGKYRVYMEYCQYGDLGRLIYRHRRYGKYLIEPFLWNMFYHLAKALVVLEYGPESPAILGQPIEDEAFDTDETSADEASADDASADDASADETSADEETLKPNKGPTESSASQPQPGNEWKPIIHNDIKPQNIFLGDEDFDTFSFYPTAKLGDFDTAFLYTPGESQEPVLPGGTDRYQPPDDIKGPWSNIYGVGVSMFEAATLESYITSEVQAVSKRKEKTKEGSIKAPVSKSSDSPSAKYVDPFDWNCGGRTPCSRRLELLILRCLVMDFKDRITARELLAETRKGLSEVRHELEEEYGLEADPVIYIDSKKEPKRLPNSYPFRLDYHGSEIEGTRYGSYVASRDKPPLLMEEYFPELFKDGPAPMRFPMRDNYYRKARKYMNLDHFRMPWETADEWNARERGWPADRKRDDEGDDEIDDESDDQSDDESDDEGGDEGNTGSGDTGKHDRNGGETDNISIFSQEEPASDADLAGNEWMIVEPEEIEFLKEERGDINHTWENEAEDTKDEYDYNKKTAEEELRITLRAKLAERRKKDIEESIREKASAPRTKRRKLSKRRSLTPKSDEDSEYQPSQPKGRRSRIRRLN